MAVTKATTSYYSFSFPDFTSSTNLGPLTTGLSFPTDCYTNLIDMNRDGLGPSGAWKTLGCAVSSCCPFERFYTVEWAWMTSYYSPGICPSDYQSCAAPTQSGLRLSSSAGEKIIFCCPNNCICPNDEDMPLEAPGACGSRLTSSGETTVYTIMNNFKDQQPIATDVYKFEPGFTQEVQVAWPIQIRIPATSSMVSATAKGSDPASTPGSADSKAPLSGGSDHGLSKGAIVGISFGGFFSIFVSCLIAYMVLRKRRNQREVRVQEEVSERVPAEEMSDVPPELAYNSPVPPYSPQSPWIRRKPLSQQWANMNEAPCELQASPNEVTELPTRGGSVARFH